MKINIYFSKADEWCYKELRKEADNDRRGVGYVIAKLWKFYKENKKEN